MNIATKLHALRRDAYANVTTSSSTTDPLSSQQLTQLTEILQPLHTTRDNVNLDEILARRIAEDLTDLVGSLPSKDLKHPIHGVVAEAFFALFERFPNAVEQANLRVLVKYLHKHVFLSVRHARVFTLVMMGSMTMTMITEDGDALGTCKAIATQVIHNAVTGVGPDHWMWLAIAVTRLELGMNATVDLVHSIDAVVEKEIMVKGATDVTFLVNTVKALENTFQTKAISTVAKVMTRLLSQRSNVESDNTLLMLIMLEVFEQFCHTLYVWLLGDETWHPNALIGPHDAAKGIGGLYDVLVNTMVWFMSTASSRTPTPALHSALVCGFDVIDTLVERMPSLAPTIVSQLHQRGFYGSVLGSLPSIATGGGNSEVAVSCARVLSTLLNPMYRRVVASVQDILVDKVFSSHAVLLTESAAVGKWMKTFIEVYPEYVPVHVMITKHTLPTYCALTNVDLINLPTNQSHDFIQLLRYEILDRLLALKLDSMNEAANKLLGGSFDDIVAMLVEGLATTWCTQNATKTISVLMTTCAALVEKYSSKGRTMNAVLHCSVAQHVVDCVLTYVLKSEDGHVELFDGVAAKLVNVLLPLPQVLVAPTVQFCMKLKKVNAADLLAEVLSVQGRDVEPAVVASLCLQYANNNSNTSVLLAMTDQGSCMWDIAQEASEEGLAIVKAFTPNSSQPSWRTTTQSSSEPRWWIYGTLLFHNKSACFTALKADTTLVTDVMDVFLRSWVGVSGTTVTCDPGVAVLLAALIQRQPAVVTESFLQHVLEAGRRNHKIMWKHTPAKHVFTLLISTIIIQNISSNAKLFRGFMSMFRSTLNTPTTLSPQQIVDCQKAFEAVRSTIVTLGQKHHHHHREPSSRPASAGCLQSIAPPLSSEEGGVDGDVGAAPPFTYTQAETTRIMECDWRPCVKAIQRAMLCGDAVATERNLRVLYEMTLVSVTPQDRETILSCLVNAPEVFTALEEFVLERVSNVEMENVSACLLRLCGSDRKTAFKIASQVALNQRGTHLTILRHVYAASPTVLHFEEEGNANLLWVWRLILSSASPSQETILKEACAVVTKWLAAMTTPPTTQDIIFEYIAEVINHLGDIVVGDGSLILPLLDRYYESRLEHVDSQVWKSLVSKRSHTLSQEVLWRLYECREDLRESFSSTKILLSPANLNNTNALFLAVCTSHQTNDWKTLRDGKENVTKLLLEGNVDILVRFLRCLQRLGCATELFGVSELLELAVKTNPTTTALYESIVTIYEEQYLKTMHAHNYSDVHSKIISLTATQDQLCVLLARHALWEFEEFVQFFEKEVAKEKEINGGVMNACLRSIVSVCAAANKGTRRMIGQRMMPWVIQAVASAHTSCDTYDAMRVLLSKDCPETLHIFLTSHNKANVSGWQCVLNGLSKLVAGMGGSQNNNLAALRACLRLLANILNTFATAADYEKITAALMTLVQTSCEGLGEEVVAVLTTLLSKCSPGSYSVIRVVLPTFLHVVLLHSEDASYKHLRSLLLTFFDQHVVTHTDLFDGQHGVLVAHALTTLFIHDRWFKELSPASLQSALNVIVILTTVCPSVQLPFYGNGTYHEIVANHTLPFRVSVKLLVKVQYACVLDAFIPLLPVLAVNLSQVLDDEDERLLLQGLSVFASHVQYLSPKDMAVLATTFDDVIAKKSFTTASQIVRGVGLQHSAHVQGVVLDLLKTLPLNDEGGVPTGFAWLLAVLAPHDARIRADPQTERILLNRASTTSHTMTMTSSSISEDNDISQALLCFGKQSVTGGAKLSRPSSTTGVLPTTRRGSVLAASTSAADVGNGLQAMSMYYSEQLTHLRDLTARQVNTAKHEHEDRIEALSKKHLSDLSALRDQFLDLQRSAKQNHQEEVIAVKAKIAQEYEQRLSVQEKQYENALMQATIHANSVEALFAAHKSRSAEVDSERLDELRREVERLTAEKDRRDIEVVSLKDSSQESMRSALQLQRQLTDMEYKHDDELRRARADTAKRFEATVIEQKEEIAQLEKQLADSELRSTVLLEGNRSKLIHQNEHLRRHTALVHDEELHRHKLLEEVWFGYAQLLHSRRSTAYHFHPVIPSHIMEDFITQENTNRSRLEEIWGLEVWDLYHAMLHQIREVAVKDAVADLEALRQFSTGEADTIKERLQSEVTRIREQCKKQIEEAKIAITCERTKAERRVTQIEFEAETEKVRMMQEHEDKVTQLQSQIAELEAEIENKTHEVHSVKKESHIALQAQHAVFEEKHQEITRSYRQTIISKNIEHEETTHTLKSHATHKEMEAATTTQSLKEENDTLIIRLGALYHNVHEYETQVMEEQRKLLEDSVDAWYGALSVMMDDYFPFVTTTLLERYRREDVLRDEELSPALVAETEAAARDRWAHIVHERNQELDKVTSKLHEVEFALAAAVKKAEDAVNEKVITVTEIQRRNGVLEEHNVAITAFLDKLQTELRETREANAKLKTSQKVTDLLHQEAEDMKAKYEAELQKQYDVICQLRKGILDADEVTHKQKADTSTAALRTVEYENNNLRKTVRQLTKANADLSTDTSQFVAKIRQLERSSQERVEDLTTTIQQLERRIHDLTDLCDEKTLAVERSRREAKILEDRAVIAETALSQREEDLQQILEQSSRVSNEFAEKSSANLSMLSSNAYRDAGMHEVEFEKFRQKIAAVQRESDSYKSRVAQALAQNVDLSARHEQAVARCTDMMVSSESSFAQKSELEKQRFELQLQRKGLEKEREEIAKQKVELEKKEGALNRLTATLTARHGVSLNAWKMMIPPQQDVVGGPPSNVLPPIQQRTGGLSPPQDSLDMPPLPGTAARRRSSLFKNAEDVDQRK